MQGTTENNSRTVEPKAKETEGIEIFKIKLIVAVIGRIAYLFISGAIPSIIFLIIIYRYREGIKRLATIVKEYFLGGDIEEKLKVIEGS